MTYRIRGTSGGKRIEAGTGSLLFCNGAGSHVILVRVWEGGDSRNHPTYHKKEFKKKGEENLRVIARWRQETKKKGLCDGPHNEES